MGRYIHNLAKQLIGEISVTSRDAALDPKDAAKKLYSNEMIYNYLWVWLTQRSPETLGKIAVCGISLEQVHDMGSRKIAISQVSERSIFSAETDGRDVLVELCIRVIIAKMADILSSIKRLGGDVEEGELEAQERRARILALPAMQERLRILRGA
ncbi:MAG: hypothetical protein JWN89_327 [Parcubacteria group bacterium]|nr:hypothetical protein [Parcubacteria group bacterium]